MRWQDIIKKWTPKRRSVLRRVVERHDRQVWVKNTAWTNTVIWEWCDIREMIDTEQLKKLELKEITDDMIQHIKKLTDGKVVIELSIPPHRYHEPRYKRDIPKLLWKTEKGIIVVNAYYFLYFLAKYRAKFYAEGIDKPVEVLHLNKIVALFMPIVEGDNQELWEEAEEIKQEAKYPLFQHIAMCMVKERRNDGSVFHGCKLG